MKITITFYLIIAGTLWHPASAYAKTDLQINQTMNQIGTVMMDLYPLLLDDATDTRLNHPGILDTQVSRLLFLLKSAKPHFLNRSKPFMISYGVLIQHLTETKKAITQNNLQYANNLLHEVTSICTSCHTQDIKQRTLFRGTGRAAFKSDFQFAEFNFLTRNYGLAIQFYEKYLKTLPLATNVKKEKKSVTALKRILTIYVQIYNEPGKAAQRFNRYIKEYHLSKLTERTLEQWVIGLLQLEKKGASNIQKLSFSQLEQYIHEYLGPLDQAGTTLVPTKTQQIFHVWLQGLLYKQLSNQPSPEHIPKLLYWLAINARTTDYSYYYSLADLYLKECMVGYSSHEYAKKCFNEYKEYIEFSYSGSLGTHIPDEVKTEIQRLKTKVYGY